MSALRAGDVHRGGETRRNHYRPSSKLRYGRFRRAVATPLHGRRPRRGRASRPPRWRSARRASGRDRPARGPVKPRARSSVPARRPGPDPAGHAGVPRARCQPEAGRCGAVLGEPRRHRLGERHLFGGALDGIGAIGARQVGAVVRPEAAYLGDHAVQERSSDDTDHDCIGTGRGEGHHRPNDQATTTTPTALTNSTTAATDRRERGARRMERTRLGRGSGRHAAKRRCRQNPVAMPRRAGGPSDPIVGTRTRRDGRRPCLWPASRRTPWSVRQSGIPVVSV